MKRPSSKASSAIFVRDVLLLDPHAYRILVHKLMKTFRTGQRYVAPNMVIYRTRSVMIQIRVIERQENKLIVEIIQAARNPEDLFDLSELLP